jgi:hypothetical protein
MLKLAKIDPGIHMADILEQPIGFTRNNNTGSKSSVKVPIHRQDMPRIWQS